jgi:hypothetical protein
MHSLLSVHAVAAASALVAVGLVAAALHKIRRGLGTVRQALPDRQACRAAGC